MGAKSADVADIGAALIRLPAKLVRDIRKSSDVQFLTGECPRVRVNGTVHDLHVSPALPTDLYTSRASHESHSSEKDAAWANWQRVGSVLHKIEVKSEPKDNVADTADADAAALAALKEGMAKIAKEKEANQTHITTAVLSNPRNRHQQLRTSTTVSRNNSAKRHFNDAGMASATSIAKQNVPSTATGDSPRLMDACRFAMIHFLAMGPASIDHIRNKTRIPNEQVMGIVQKIARPVQDRPEQYILSDRAYKELTVWKFKYPSQDDRQLAVDNAVKAYDRLRLGEGDKVWQTLLRPSDRGKGIWLSKLGRLGDNAASRGLTPQHLSENTANNNNNDSAVETKLSTTTTTANHGASPRPPSGKTATVAKRLFSKDPQKARMLEDAKAKKRKEREAATEDRISGERSAKRQAVRKADPKIKSAEFVHSSSDESGAGAVTQPARRKEPQLVPRLSTATSHVKKTSTNGSQPPARVAPAPVKTAVTNNRLTKPAASGQVTPRQGINVAPAPTGKHKIQLSPRKGDSRPSVPSPLGPRPRVASDVSERGAQRGKAIKPANTSTTTTPLTSERSRAIVKDHLKKPPDATHFPSKPNVAPKRKAMDVIDAMEVSKTKHRKSDSTSSQSGKSNSSANHNSTEHTSPDSGGTSDSSSLAVDGLTFSQGVALARKFQDQYYPAYSKMYDEQLGREARGEAVGREERERLWEMHKRLEQIKRDIYEASKREHIVER